MKRQIGLLMAVILLVTGCNTNSNSTANPTSPGAEVTAAIDSVSTINSGMKTHVDKLSSIAFDYPSGWSIVEPATDGAVIYTYTIASFDLNDPAAKSEGDLQSGQTKIDVTFYGADETPDSARRTVQSDVDSGMVVISKQETRIAPDGSPAYYYVIQGRLGGTAQVLYTRINGRTVGVVAYGDGANFEDVVKSLRKAG
jgi:hypothetical protein